MATLRALYKKYNIVNHVCGNVGVQMGGWYRKEIKSVADLKGLNMRIGGIGGMVLSKLGAVPQQIPGDIYPALEKGTIDAAEWIGPYDDEKLGFNKVAPYYYSPGWFEGSASITSMVHDKAWEALPPAYQAAFEAAAGEQTMRMLAHYDARNPLALRKLIAGGAKVSFFPKEVMDAAYNASQELCRALRRIRISRRSSPTGRNSRPSRRAGSGWPKARWTTHLRRRGEGPGQVSHSGQRGVMTTADADTHGRPGKRRWARGFRARRTRATCMARATSWPTWPCPD